MTKKKKMYISIAAFAATVFLVVTIFLISHKKYDSDIMADAGKNVMALADYVLGEAKDDSKIGRAGIAENSDYFFIMPDMLNAGNFRNIYKISKKTGKADIMCYDPQCTHMTDTCSACMDTSKSLEGCYNERLYYIDGEHSASDELVYEEWLMSMDMEGKDRRKEVKINEYILSHGDGWMLRSISFYGEEIYLSKTYRETGEDDITRDAGTEVYRIDLKTDKMTKIYEKVQKGIYGRIVEKEGDIVYIRITQTEYDENGGYCKYYTIIAYDENTEKLEEEYIGNYDFLGASGDNRYYESEQENEAGILAKKTGSEEYKTVLDLGEYGTKYYIYKYKDYIMVVSWKLKDEECIDIYDMEGEFIKKISIESEAIYDITYKNGLIFKTMQEDENSQIDIYVCPIRTDINTWTKLN